MLSLEATSHQTMQLVATMFDKASVRVADVPVIGKSYDDSYLRPANQQIGERECACGAACICLSMARVRHGPESDLAFIGTEFLLPTERAAFLAGRGLPPRRKKCLVCTRFLMTHLYVQARVDPNFKVSSAPIGIQTFGNATLPSDASGTDGDPWSGQAMADLPHSVSRVLSEDGYRADAMLFVDEEFASARRASREGQMATLVWKPVVKFKSRHYRYIRSAKGPRLVQVGVGTDDPTGAGQGFQAPAAAEAAPPSA